MDSTGQSEVRCDERRKLEAAFLRATIEFTSRLNQQMVAITQDDGGVGLLNSEEWIDEARQLRARAKDALLAHIREHNCRS
jgi:DNA-binding transcriptional MocR family regulator